MSRMALRPALRQAAHGGARRADTTRIAYVETTGNDATGVIGNSLLPFATINGALDAIWGVRHTPAASWWVVPGKTCLGAYQAIGAASYAASLVNLANPGTFDAYAGSAPDWSAARGWLGTAANTRLFTGIPNNYGSSWLVQFTNAPASTKPTTMVIPNYGSGWRIWYANCTAGDLGGYLEARSAPATAGNFGGAGVAAYQDGAYVGDCASAGWDASTWEYHLLNDEGGILGFNGGYVQCAAFYSDTLSAGEMLTVATAMRGATYSQVYTLRLGAGTFAAVAGDANAVTTKLEDGLVFQGAGTPTIKADNTGLENGTIIKGVLCFDRNNIELYDLGIDSGSAVCTADNGGVAQDALSFLNVGSVPGKPERTRIKVKRVATICQAANAEVHAALFHNVTGCEVDDLTTRFGVHGAVFFASNTTASRLRCSGHQFNALLLKGNATGPCHDVTISDVIASAVAPGDTVVGIRFHAQGANVNDILIDGVVITGVTTGVVYGAGVGDTIDNADVSNLIGVDTVSQSGTVTNCEVNGAPV